MDPYAIVEAQRRDARLARHLVQREERNLEIPDFIFRTKQKGTDIKRSVQILGNEQVFMLFREDLENKKNDIDFEDNDTKLVLGLPSPKRPEQVDDELLKGQEAYTNAYDVYR